VKTLTHLTLLLTGGWLMTISCVSCGRDGDHPDNSNSQSLNTTNPTNHNSPTLKGNKMKITVGAQTFSATLFDNASVTAFKALLPLTIDMTELNRNEKYFDLPQSLPYNASNPGTIKNGDLMLYGSQTLVLFYTSFSTSYSYTALGRVDNPKGLAAALGRGNVKVTYNLD
jgi:hypothetical protein